MSWLMNYAKSGVGAVTGAVSSGVGAVSGAMSGAAGKVAGLVYSSPAQAAAAANAAAVQANIAAAAAGTAAAAGNVPAAVANANIAAAAATKAANAATVAAAAAAPAQKVSKWTIAKSGFTQEGHVNATAGQAESSVAEASRLAGEGTGLRTNASGKEAKHKAAFESTREARRAAYLTGNNGQSAGAGGHHGYTRKTMIATNKAGRLALDNGPTESYGVGKGPSGGYRSSSRSRSRSRRSSRSRSRRSSRSRSRRRVHRSRRNTRRAHRK